MPEKAAMEDKMISATVELARALNLIRCSSDYRKRRVVVRGLPYRADIEPTTRCNFACRMCQTAQWQRPRHDLTVDQFTHIVDSIPTLYNIKLVGMGEPLLNPHFFAILQVARHRRLRVNTTTNGSLLDHRRRSALLTSGIYHIDVSIDGARPDTHNSIRPGADWEHIVANVSAFVRERGGRKRPIVRVWTVPQRDSIGELPQLVDLCNSMGVDALAAQLALTNFGSSCMEERARTLRAPATEQAAEAIRAARKRAATIGLPFSCADIAPEPATRPSVCRWPWERTFISVEGFVGPCCLVSDPEVVNFGNLFSQPFTAIWRGPEYQALREAFRCAKPPAYCRACAPDYKPSAQPRARGFAGHAQAGAKNLRVS
jgi:MoaA/NifB/PqqE/SkfB family radical SAM enzyme